MSVSTMIRSSFILSIQATIRVAAPSPCALFFDPLLVGAPCWIKSSVVQLPGRAATYVRSFLPPTTAAHMQFLLAECMLHRPQVPI